MHLQTDSKEHFSRPTKKAVPVRLITSAEFKSKTNGLSQVASDWAKANGFAASSGQTCLVPGDSGAIGQVLFGLGGGKGQGKQMLHAKLARTLPAGTYFLEGDRDDPAMDQLAWAMGGYSFDRYRGRKHQTPKLAVKRSPESDSLAEAVFFTRDLINTPANDMGPDALEKAFRKLATSHKASVGRCQR